MFVKIKQSVALDFIDKNDLDNKIPFGKWSDAGLTLIEIFGNEAYLKFQVINKQKFILLLMKYDLEFEVIQ
jgi:hypothetical protein